MHNVEGRPATSRSWIVRAAVLPAPAWLILSVFIFPNPLPIKLALAMMLFVGVLAPAAGLLLVAFAAPLGQLAGQFVGAESFRLSEALVIAFLTGWLLHPRADRPGPRVPAAVGWLFAFTILGSIAGLAWQIGDFRGEIGRTLDVLVPSYFDKELAGDRLGLADAARLLEGLALAAVTVSLFRERPRLANLIPAASGAAAVIAGISSVLLWRGIAPAAVLPRYARIGYRISAHVPDVNAAGSYFAMILCLALGMTLRPGERYRGAWAAVSCASAAGLWLSRSRTAFGAAAVVLLVTATWTVLSRRKAVVRAGAIGAALLVAVIVIAVRVHQSNFGVDYRQQFLETSVRMIEARPLFGVGIGQYYRASAMFLSPQLAWNYGTENAHNNFLQIGGELGVVGLALFVTWLGIGLARAVIALKAAPGDLRLLGATAGLVAFIGTWLGSHPLLVDEVAFPFWIQFGLMMALAGAALLNRAESATAAAANRAPRIRTNAAVAVIGVCLAIAAMRATRPPIRPAVSPDVDGFYGWETSGDGARFRWSHQFASVFVPSEARRVSIPISVPAGLHMTGSLEVEVMIGGVFQVRQTMSGGRTSIDLGLAGITAPSRFKRIDLKTNREWQPALYIPGNSDLRSVGVQVGECQWFSAR
jgi:O-antigen ligase